MVHKAENDKTTAKEPTRWKCLRRLHALWLLTIVLIAKLPLVRIGKRVFAMLTHVVTTFFFSRPFSFFMSLVPLALFSEKKIVPLQDTKWTG